jgi:hypothetical protein
MREPPEHWDGRAFSQGLSRLGEDAKRDVLRAVRNGRAVDDPSLAGWVVEVAKWIQHYAGWRFVAQPAIAAVLLLLVIPAWLLLGAAVALAYVGGLAGGMAVITTWVARKARIAERLNKPLLGDESEHG